MREIKFRMWNKEIKEMYDVGLINFQQRLIFMKHYEGYTQSSFALEDVELMQFTGLYDKNGKEIYEGDIVRFEDIGEDGYEYKEGFDFENEAQVIYEDGQVTLINFGEGDNSHYANDGQPDILDEILRNGNCEVIGNIYDNPELLERSSNGD